MFVLWCLSFMTPSSARQLLSRHRGTVYQSTTGARGVPGRAVDGNHKQHYGDNSCTHTEEPRFGTANWWLLDLGQRAHITLIKIWNRSHKDCCEDRINGAMVWVDSSQVGVLHHSRPEYHLHISVTGRYVRVTQSSHPLTLCELEVYGDYIGESGEGPHYPHYPVLLSRHRPTSQSGGSNSPGAVDGVFKGSAGHDGACARTDYQSLSWWQVDLGKDYKVSMVVLYARFGKGQETLRGAKVFVDETLCGVFGHEYRYLFAIQCPSNGLIGSKVKIIREHNYIEICEAEVFGVEIEPKPTTAPTDPLTDPPSPRPDPHCVDLDDKCPVLARQHKCSQTGVLAKCPFSCHQCSCGDNFRFCRKFADAGLCRHHAIFMDKHCKQSCDLCQCADTHSHCAFGAAQSLCTSDPSFPSLCPLSCNQCQCGDNLQHCRTMTLAGQCVDNPSFMLVHCAESCNQCGGCADNPPYSKECAARAARGECDTNGDMVLHCAASCNLCAQDDENDEEDEDDKEKEDDDDSSEDEEHPWI